MLKEEKRNNKNTLGDEVVITKDNIELLSQVIALSALKKFQNYAYGINKHIYEMHKHLQYDIARKKELDPYTDAYDLVQEASCFLCHFIGHKLGEFAPTRTFRGHGDKSTEVAGGSKAAPAQ